MNGVTTYRTERDLDESSETSNRKSKKVKFPRCRNIGYKIVKEKCDNCAALLLLCFFPLICCIPYGYGKKEIHYCRYCNYDCSDVEEYEENDENCCLII